MDWGVGADDERRAIAAKIREHSFAYWNETLEKAGQPFSPVLHIKEAMVTPQAEAMGVMADTTVNGGPARVPNVPIHIASREAAVAEPHGPATVSSPPSLGQHTAEFLSEIGWSVPLARQA
jgi:crotonobetainyl-CoA:carnitine CoA-transferase CaiB-like acyl-CoA transferase